LQQVASGSIIILRVRSRLAWVHQQRFGVGVDWVPEGVMDVSMGLVRAVR